MTQEKQMTKLRKRGLMASVLSRMSAGDCLISDRHAESMLMGLLSEAEQVTDPSAAWDEVRSEVMASWGWEDSAEGPSKPFIYQDGVAVIPVHGILINRFNYCWGFVTGYDFIRKQKNLALADDDVKLIVYDHDTPGGEAAGCDELAREILSDRDTKPSMALVNSLSASGGFWLAAPCNRVVCAPSGSVGSIGVYILHMNIAKMLAEWGIEAEFIKNGKFKTSGNPYEGLSDEDREYLQAMVDERAGEFHRAVAEFRGIEESVVKGTQARVMRPTEALSLGLIDAAESPTTAVASFVAELGNAADEPITDDSQEDVTMAEMSSEDRATVANETKARIKGIMTHDEAKGREALAEHLAYNTDQSVEDAVAMLKVAPKAEDPKPGEGEDDDKGDADDKSGDDKSGDDKGGADDKSGDDKGGDSAKGGQSQFEKAMDQGKHPDVGPDGDGKGGDGDEAVSANVTRILGAQAAATGRRFDKDKAA
jgi:signal peptide peptidase SppA